MKEKIACVALATCLILTGCQVQTVNNNATDSSQDNVHDELSEGAQSANFQAEEVASQNQEVAMKNIFPF